MNEPHDTDHAQVRELLGPYALGQLSPDEAGRVEAHLAGCDACPADLADIGPAAAALADLRGAAPLRDDGPPDDLGSRVVGRVEAERRAVERARRLRVAGASAAAAAAAAIVLVAGFRLTQPDTPVAAPVPLERVRVVDQDPAVRATAGVVPHTWGMEVKLHATGFASGQRYLVSVRGVDGKEHDAGEFVGTGSRPMDCNLSSSVLRAQATGFEVRDAAGTVLVSSRF